MSRDTINSEAVNALNRLVGLYIREFFPKVSPKSRKPKDKGAMPLVVTASYTKRDRDIDHLLKCSEVEEPTIKEINYALFLTIEAMKGYEYEKTYGITNMKIVRRKVEEIKSIMAVSEAFPDSAMRRLKNITNVKLIQETY